MYYPIRRTGRQNNYFRGTCWCKELVKKRFRRTCWCNKWFRKFVVNGNDPKSDSNIATHTTNGIPATDTTNRVSTLKLFINPAIQAVVQPSTPLVTVKVEVVQESLSPRQTSLPQANITDTARPYACIFQTTWNVIRTKRDIATPRNTSSPKRGLERVAKAQRS